MKLGEWINQHPKGKRVAARKRLAKKLGVSESYVRSMANGNRPIPIELALSIEQGTGGAVTVNDSRPDFFGRFKSNLPAEANA